MKIKCTHSFVISRWWEEDKNLTADELICSKCLRIVSSQELEDRRNAHINDELAPPWIDFETGRVS